MFFLPNVTTPTCLFSKFHKNEKSLQPSVQYSTNWTQAKTGEAANKVKKPILSKR